MAAAEFEDIHFESIKPDSFGNWINNPESEFHDELPIASKEAKARRVGSQSSAIFQTFALGVSTNRDDWMYDFSDDALRIKVAYLNEKFRSQRRKGPFDKRIKWSRNLKRRFSQNRKETIGEIGDVNYRPFVRKWHYDSDLFVDERGLRDEFKRGQIRNTAIAFTDPTAQKPWFACAVDIVPDLHFVGSGAGTIYVPIAVITSDGACLDNITDWALDQFRAHYKARTPSPPATEGPVASATMVEATESDEARRTELGKPANAALGGAPHPDPTPSGHLPPQGRKGRAICKDAIFHYVYAVLHDPVYREKYAQNLKREFPRIPLYADFWRWVGWGETLMGLHIGYESAQPWPLTRTDTPDAKAAAAGLKPRPILRADQEHGIIALDSETQLSGVPPEAWAYKLGNRCALEWILDQHKEKTPKDQTIREKFNTYRFADSKRR